jgi:putative ATP-binding cassette transporter
MLLLLLLSYQGKSSLIRAVSGLWREGSGEVCWFADPEQGGHINSSSSSMSHSNSSGSAPTRSAPANVFFLPQKPYNLLGSLRQQIAYPSFVDEGETAADRAAYDGLLLDLLRAVKLDALAARMGGLDVANDWSKVLSLGEQQRLAFARVLYNKPSVVFLDGKLAVVVVLVAAAAVAVVVAGVRLPRLIDLNDRVLSFGRIG